MRRRAFNEPQVPRTILVMLAPSPILRGTANLGLR